jgi:hypothetical protein
MQCSKPIPFSRRGKRTKPLAKKAFSASEGQSGIAL